MSLLKLQLFARRSTVISRRVSVESSVTTNTALCPGTAYTVALLVGTWIPLAEASQVRWLEQRGWSTECCQSCALCAYLCPSVSILVSDSSVKQTRLSSGVLEEATEKRRGNTVRTYVGVSSCTVPYIPWTEAEGEGLYLWYRYR